MRLLKDNIRILKLLFLVILVLSSFGCKQYIYDEEYQINDDLIFEQNDEEYYVYFYKNNCPYCEKAYDIVMEYLRKDSSIKLYVCDITESSIARIYEGDNGQGTQGKYFVDGVQDYNDLYIAGAPSIIKVEKGQSTFVAAGRKNVVSFIEELLAEISK